MDNDVIFALDGNSSGLNREVSENELFTSHDMNDYQEKFIQNLEVNYRSQLEDNIKKSKELIQRLKDDIEDLDLDMKEHRLTMSRGEHNEKKRNHRNLEQRLHQEIGNLNGLKKELSRRLVSVEITDVEQQQLLKNGTLTPFEMQEIQNEHLEVNESKKRKLKILDPEIAKKRRKSGVESEFNSFLESHHRTNHRLMHLTTRDRRRKQKSAVKVRKPRRKHVSNETEEVYDDGDLQMYNERIKNMSLEKNDPSKDLLMGNKKLKIPDFIWEKLFEYQKTGVRWLWELHEQEIGGILADEMGLGKTIQIVAFLGSLHYSGLFKNALIVSPSTVMKQWVREFHQWYPKFRICIFHDSGTSTDFETVIEDICSGDNGILVCTYNAIRDFNDLLTSKEWDYVIIDEGHKIKNPDSHLTLSCKRFDTIHRIILTGTPIQNNLVELWSLMDFVAPGYLGNLNVFKGQFCLPISQGGYANASDFHVQTSYNCAITLKNMIAPYLLRRLKKDVGTNLPGKTEKVLFCKLSQEQVILYREYLSNPEIKRALDGNLKIFGPVSVLRNICNHPELANFGVKVKSDANFVERSGKMKVVHHLLQSWKNNSKVLLFSQSLLMLDQLELYLQEMNYAYLRMDGKTPINKRLAMIDTFNKDKKIFVFLLTTHVGGIGVNLTGASKVLLYDVNWNPSVDKQSLERAWRIGQNEHVTVYRLMTQGTIEEKMYHRQVFKVYLSNKILTDPRQSKSFKQSELYDLFTLGSEYDMVTSGRKSRRSSRSRESETSEFFRQSLISQRDATGKELFKIGDHISQQQEKQETEGTKKEALLLQQLFNDEEITVFDHEKIVNQSRPDQVLVAKEASRIAKQAANVLLKSSYQLRKERNLTRDNRFGSVRKDFTSRAILLSRDLLKPPTSEQPSNPVKNLRGEYNVKLVKDMQKFFLKNNNETSSSNLVTEFGTRVTGENAALFKALLRQISTLDTSRKIWVLKEEYRV